MKNMFILLVFVSYTVVAQTKEDLKPSNESYITTDILSPFYFQGGLDGLGNYGAPRWRLGFIKNFSPKTKIGIDFGYGNANSSVISTFDTYSLWEIRPEYYHIINPNRKTLKYFALEAFYIHQNEVFNSQSFFNKQKDYLTFDKADYRRQKMGILPKFGMFINLNNRMGINVYTGLGINYRINTYSNFTNLRAREFNEEHFPPYYRNEGNKIGVEFSLGLKLYYRVKN